MKSPEHSKSSPLGWAAEHLVGRLEISAGQASDAGMRAANEDCMGLQIPEEPTRTLKGAAAVIADGVSSAEAGREASETCVQSFLADYYSTPDTWSVEHSAQVVLTALNRWLYGMSHGSHESHRGYVSTFTAAVIKSQTVHLFHVGDTRAYLLRDGAIEQLTRDHTTQISEAERYLSRAMGMDVSLEVDHRAVALQPGDCLVLTSDGVHDWLSSAKLGAIVENGLGSGLKLEKVCTELIDAAKRGGSDDNLTAQVLRIDDVAPPEREEVHRELTRLPFPPPLVPGMEIDGYRIEAELHASRRSQVYLVSDVASGEKLAMKTPSINFEDDPAYIEHFVMEAWIGRRIEHPNVVRIVDTGRRPEFLYYLMEYVEGPTLAEWAASRERPDIGAVVDLVDQIASGLRAFYRRETLHQDLKPGNIMVDREARIRIIDFGSCWVAGIREIDAPLERNGVLGTASYAPPENRWGETAGTRSEMFALGSIAYELLTGELPYGEAIEACREPRDFQRLEYVPSYRHNPMIPVWIDGALRKAVAIHAGRRYGEYSELVYDLRHPNRSFLDEAHRPLIERSPLRFWKGLAALLALLQLLTLWLLLR